MMHKGDTDFEGWPGYVFIFKYYKFSASVDEPARAVPAATAILGVVKAAGSMTLPPLIFIWVANC